MPTILITNDDGVSAPGLRALYEAVRDFGDVVIVAPEQDASGVAHTITYTRPLHVREVFCEAHAVSYAVDGSPADCIKLAFQELMPIKPDLVLSGINVGANYGMAVLYSGTVAGALEGAILGCSAIAISVDAYDEPDFTGAAQVARILTQRILQKSLPSGVALNVNVPAMAFDEIIGLMLTTQGNSRFEEYFTKKNNAHGVQEYWMYGELVHTAEPLATCDFKVVKQGWASVTPLYPHLGLARPEGELEMLRQVKAGLAGIVRD